MDAPAFERLRSSFRGELVLPSDEGYEAARRVWNTGCFEKSVFHSPTAGGASGALSGMRAKAPRSAS